MGAASAVFLWILDVSHADGITDAREFVFRPGMSVRYLYAESLHRLARVPLLRFKAGYPSAYVRHVLSALRESSWEIEEHPSELRIVQSRRTFIIEYSIEHPESVRAVLEVLERRRDDVARLVHEASRAEDRAEQNRRIHRYRKVEDQISKFRGLSSGRD